MDNLNEPRNTPIPLPGEVESPLPLSEEEQLSHEVMGDQDEEVL